MAGADSTWWSGTEDGVSRLTGRVFKGLCFGATVFGIVTVLVLLLYVAGDALRLTTADAGWYLTYAAAVLVPAALLAGYYYFRDRAAGEVAYASLGIPVAGSLVGAGVAVVFIEVVSPVEWFGLAVGLALGGGAAAVHRRLRSAGVAERLAVVVGAPLLAVVGVPSVSVDFTARTPVFGSELFTVSVSTPQLLPGVPAVVTAAPVLPADWLLLVVSVALPAGLVAGWYVGARRESRRAAWATALATPLAGVAGAVLGIAAGIGGSAGVILVTTAALPLAVYVDRVYERGEGALGLAFPVAVAAGLVAGTVLVDALGFAGPAAWLDWQFLTSAHSRTPADAGIYPALVGSVLMLVVIVVAIFPLGVGAAIYLEEYAPSGGRWGKIVTLIEINIGNLAGVPSVVYGLLGLALFVRGVGLQAGIVIVGGLTVGLLILPIIIISAQEAVRAVPESARRASYGVGATKWQTIRNVVLPEALPGIMTGTILALGRAIGETAPLLMIGAAAVVRIPPDSFFSLFSAMPRQIYAWSSEIKPEFRYGVLAAGVITLLVVLLMMNATAILIRNKYQKRD